MADKKYSQLLDATERKKLVRRADERAAGELKRLHPEDYQRLQNKHRKALGLERVGKVKVGVRPGD